MLDEPVRRAVWVHEIDRPALVLGSAQRDDVVDAAAVDRCGVDVVHRRSGGGAVLLTPGDVLWIDVVIPRDDRLWADDVGRSMWWLGDVWAAALGDGARVHRGPIQSTTSSRLVCFAGVGPGEVTRDGRKLVGISQRRGRAGARFQCALYRAFDPAAVGRLLAISDVERAALAGYLAAHVAIDAHVTADHVLAGLPGDAAGR